VAPVGDVGRDAVEKAGRERAAAEAGLSGVEDPRQHVLPDILVW